MNTRLEEKDTSRFSARKNWLLLRNDFEVLMQRIVRKQIVFHLTIEHFDDNLPHEDISPLF